MIILTIRTDKPEAEIGLYDDTKRLGHETWEAHRQLSTTIHSKIKALLEAHHKSWSHIQGIVTYKGPGSFTGLRIGLTVGNTLAYALDIPITATNNHWIEQGVATLQTNATKTPVVPEYGALAHITQQRR